MSSSAFLSAAAPIIAFEHDVEVLYSTQSAPASGRLFFKAEPGSDSDDPSSMPSLRTIPRSDASLEREVFVSFILFMCFPLLTVCREVLILPGPLLHLPPW